MQIALLGVDVADLGRSGGVAAIVCPPERRERAGIVTPLGEQAPERERGGRVAGLIGTPIFGLGIGRELTVLVPRGGNGGCGRPPFARVQTPAWARRHSGSSRGAAEPCDYCSCPPGRAAQRPSRRA